MDLCRVTFRSFVVQWSAKITGLQPQLKPLVTKILDNEVTYPKNRNLLTRTI